MTKVVNLRVDKFDVYIGRPSIFGNPFGVVKYGREGCIAEFKEYFYKRIADAAHSVYNAEFKRRIDALKDKTLGCYCKPKACHGDVIAEYLDKGVK